MAPPPCYHGGMEPLAAEKRAMIDAARQASEVLRGWFTRVSEHGGDINELLGTTIKNTDYASLGYEDAFTHADTESEEVILPILSACRDIRILSEETNPTMRDDAPEGEQRWVVDPLDGTSRFKKGLPDFSITIALQTKRGGTWHTDIGLVALPMEQRMYMADEKGTQCLDAEQVKERMMPELAGPKAFEGDRAALMKGKRIELVLYSKAHFATVNDTRERMMALFEQQGAYPQKTFSTAMVLTKMCEPDGVDTTVLAGNALEFAWDVDAALYIAKKAGLEVRATEMAGEPALVVARSRALATALVHTLKDQYRAACTAHAMA